MKFNGIDRGLKILRQKFMTPLLRYKFNAYQYNDHYDINSCLQNTVNKFYIQ